MSADRLRSLINELEGLEKDTKDSLYGVVPLIYLPPDATEPRDRFTEDRPPLTPERAFELGKGYKEENLEDAIHCFKTGSKLALKRTAEKYQNLKDTEAKFKTESERYNSKIAEIESEIEGIKKDKGPKYEESEEYNEAMAKLDEAKKSPEYHKAQENLNKARKELDEAKALLISGVKEYGEVSGDISSEELNILRDHLDLVIGLVSKSYTKESTIDTLFTKKK